MAAGFNMEIYIRSSACISPQQTFGSVELPAEIKIFSENRLTAIEPDYKTHLNIPAARRMSRLIKMGVCSALSCLKDADVKIPDAIICGTGLGCMEDSEKFLASLIENNEQTLSPTSFIFSTHNTVAGQVALLLHCNNYNFTHTHRGLSFENSLLDAMLFLSDYPQSNVLVGATDEVTATSFRILERLGAVKKETGNVSIIDSPTGGTIAGEGSTFFALKSQADSHNLAKVSAVSTFSNPLNENEIAERINDFIRIHNISADDFIMTGVNGDVNGDKIYHHIIESHFSKNSIGYYKHLCGEYHTSTAFACWISALALKAQFIPGYLVMNKTVSLQTNRILIFNHYKGREFSLMLLEKC
ncbi:MAG: beta-ketoacyl synthase chain length factor [Bacteroidota bacterium]